MQLLQSKRDLHGFFFRFGISLDVRLVFVELIMLFVAVQ